MDMNLKCFAIVLYCIYEKKNKTEYNLEIIVDEKLCDILWCYDCHTSNSLCFK